MDGLLDASTLTRLVRDGLFVLFGSGRRSETASRPGASMALSGEPFADLNMVLVYGGQDPARALTEYVERGKGLGLPLLALLGGEVADELGDVATGLGMVHAAAFPLMVFVGRPDLTIRDDVAVRRVEHETDLRGSAEALVDAFGLAVDSVLRAIPVEALASPVFDVFVAEHRGQIVSSVTTTVHGDTVGIWAMGTAASSQKHGVGRALLTQVMAHHADRGRDRFFLGATAAGKPLYDRVGYQTVVTTQVWLHPGATPG